MGEIQLQGYSSDSLETDKTFKIKNEKAMWHKYDFPTGIRYYKNKLTLIDDNVKYLGKAPEPKHDHWHVQNPKPINIKSKRILNEHGKLVFPKCCYCETTLDHHNYTRDHIIPVSRGGKNQKWNIRPCCRECNTEKDNLMLSSYIMYLCLLQNDFKPRTKAYLKIKRKIDNANKIAVELTISMK